jgi:hypothetical protein
MKKFLKLLFLIPLIIAGVALAHVNREAVTVYLDPFPGGMRNLEVTVPLYIVMFVSMMAGVIIGGVATWVEQGGNRRSARRAKAELKRLLAERARHSLQAPADNRTKA